MDISVCKQESMCLWRWGFGKPTHSPHITNRGRPKREGKKEVNNDP